jgi:CBS domain-containing protein
MRAEQIMSQQRAVCTAGTSLRSVAQLMLENDCEVIPVVSDLESMAPVGIITDRDIVVRAVARGLDVSRTNVAVCMSAPCIAVELHDKVEECRRILEDRQLRHLVVVDRAGRLRGIITQADVAQFRKPDLAAEAVYQI